MVLKVFSVLVGSSFVFAILGEKMDLLSEAVTSGAKEAVSLSLSMLGVTCLWKGIIAVFESVGGISFLSRLFRPFLRLIYPRAFSEKCGDREICANFAANFLGLGNAALPTGLAAMQKLSGRQETKADMTTFAVLATVPVQLMPTTLIALRSSAGSEKPFAILFPALLSSVCTYACAIVICKVINRANNIRKTK